MVPAILHGLWDFGLITSTVVHDKSFPGAGIFIFADLVTLIIVLVHRHRISPAAATAPG